MKKHLWIYVIIIFIAGTIFSVSTEYIDHFDFSDIRQIKLSNISILKNGGISLSVKWQDIYQTDGIIWSMEQDGEDFYIGTGDNARLIKLTGAETNVVFEKTNYMLFSDVAVVDNKIVVAAFPDGPVFELNKKFKEKNKFEIDSKYVWDIVENNNGYYLLCGNPAAIYSVVDDEAEMITELSNQDNIIKGIMNGNALYFIADKHLMKLENDKVIALASFDIGIIDFIFYDENIFLITASRDDASISGRANEQNQVMQSYENKDISESIEKSRLYEVSRDGAIEMLFETSEVKFLALSIIDYEIIIGTDKDGGYYTFDDTGNFISYTSIGPGKYVKAYKTDEAVYALLMYPDRIVRLDEDYAEEGYILSKVVDTDNVSTFGVPNIEDDIYPGTDYRVETRTGKVSDTEYWEDWIEIDDSIQSSPGRFIQYKITFTSDGDYSPVISDISIPYVQMNLKPRLTDISVSYNSSYVTHKWTSYDPNNDTLEYDFYISMDGMEWIKINDDPLDSTSYNIYFQNFPMGTYRSKVIASDIKDNVENEVETAYIVSDTFYLDDDPPVIDDLSSTEVNGDYIMRFTATDTLLPIKTVQYTINGEEWINVLPEDRIYDSLSEVIQLTYHSEEPFYIQFKVTDLLGNATTEGLMIR